MTADLSLTQILIQVFLAATLSLTAWTLLIVIKVDKNQALGRAKNKQQDLELADMHLRLVELATRVVEVEKGLALVQQTVERPQRV